LRGCIIAGTSAARQEKIKLFRNNNFRMKKLFIPIILTCSTIGLFTGLSIAAEDANRLFSNASQLLQSAQETEKTSYSDAFKLYREALDKLEGIIKEYPASKLVAELRQGQVKIGPYTLAEFQQSVIPKAKRKAQAEEDPLACAVFVAKTREDQERQRNIKPSIVVDAILKYLELKQYDQALQVARILRYADDKAETLAEIASRYAQAGQEEKASDILWEAFQIARTIENDYYKDVALNKIALEYTELGQCDQALQAAKAIRDGSVYLVGIDAKIAGKYMELKKKGEAFQVLSQALEIAKTLRASWEKGGALAEVASKYAELGQYGQAVEIAKSIEYLSDRYKALIAIAVLYAEAGQYEQAMGVAKIIEDDSFSSIALEKIAMKYTEMAEYDQALQVAKTIKYLPTKVKTLADIALKFAETGQKKQAMDILSEASATAAMIEDSYNKAHEYCELSSKYAQVGEREYAVKILNDTFPIVRTIKEDYKPDVLVELVNRYAEVADKDKIEEMLSQAIQIAGTLEDDGGFESKAPPKSSALYGIASKYAELGQYDQALKLARTIKGLNAEDLLAREFSGKYVAAGQYDQALKLAGTIKVDSIKGEAFVSMAMELMRAGQKEKASEVLSQAFHLAKTIDDDSTKSHLLMDVAVKYAEIGQYAQALEMVKIIKYAGMKSKALAEIGAKYAETGQKLGAEIKQILHEIIKELNQGKLT
jgi:tetratricopeptide (TPR) repeat protein